MATGQRSIKFNRFKAHFSGKHADLKVAANAVKLSLEVTEKALDGMPIYGPKAAISAVLRIIEQCEKCTDNTQLLKDTESRLERLRNAVIDPLSRPSTAISSELQAAADGLVWYLHSITTGWNAKLSQNLLKRFLNAGEYEAGLMGLGRDIDDAVTCFQVASAVRQERKIDEIRGILSRNSEDTRQRDERLHKALKSQVGRTARATAGGNLDPIEAMPYAMQANYDSAAHNEIRTCLLGTRVEVMERIRTFIMNTEADQMKNYLLSGMAGLGKSTIARSICEEVDRQQDTDLAASFFFSRRAADSDLRDPDIVIPTLAYQLAHYDGGFREALKEELIRVPLLPTKGPQFQAEGLLAKPLSKMTPRQHPVLVVLDAFDECDREAIAEDVLRYILESIAAAPCNIKLLVTSRPEAHIRAVFMKSRTHDSLILHEIEDDIVKGDIRLYLQTSLRTISSTLGFKLPEDWVTQEEVELLVGKSGKLFIYAATAIRLLSNTKVNPRSVLQKLLRANIGAASGVHAYLDETYKTILQAAVPESGEEAEVVEDIRQILGTIIHLQGALAVENIDRLLMKDSGYTRSAFNSLHSVVLVPESDDRSPHMYHQSFPDFLLDPQRCLDIRFLIKPEDHHTNLSLHCLKLLNQYLRRDMAGIEHLLLPHSEIRDFDRKVTIALPPALVYACRFWAEHLVGSRRGDPDVMQSLLIFVLKNILYWVECMSLLGTVESAIRSIQMALQWAEESKAPTGATAMLQDTARFLNVNWEPIRSCALQVYRTALVFTPSETILFANFKYESRGSRVIRGDAQTWPACLAVWDMPAVIWCITFSPNGARLALAAGIDDSFCICNSFTGEATSVLRGHSKSVMSVAFSPDGTRIASGSYDATVRVWDAQSSNELAILQGHSRTVRSVAFSPDGTRIASGSYDNTVRVWDAQSGKELIVLQGHSSDVNSMAFSPDGTRIISGSDDKTIRAWDARSGEERAILRGHSGWVRSVAFSPDGSRIASGSNDKTSRVWGAQSNKELAVLHSHLSTVFSMTFSPDGTRIASGSSDSTVRVWDAQSGKQLMVLQGHSNNVNSVAFSPDGSRIVSGSDDQTVRVWDAQPGKQLAARNAHSDSISSVEFSQDGTSIIINGREPQKLPNPGTGNLHSATGSTPSSTFADELSFDPSTRWIVEQTSRKHILFIPRSYKIKTELSFSPSGGLAAFGTEDDVVVVIQL